MIKPSTFIADPPIYLSLSSLSAAPTVMRPPASPFQQSSPLGFGRRKEFWRSSPCPLCRPKLGFCPGRKTRSCRGVPMRPTKCRKEAIRCNRRQAETSDDIDEGRCSCNKKIFCLKSTQYFGRYSSFDLPLQPTTVL